MSLYADYCKERGGRETIETENGFMVYEVRNKYRESGKECFIHDAYVKPAHRRSGEGARMLAAVVAIAKEQGCSIVCATVCPTANGASDAMRSMLNSGWQLHGSVADLIGMQKEI